MGRLKYCAVLVIKEKKEKEVEEEVEDTGKGGKRKMRQEIRKRCMNQRGNMRRGNDGNSKQ